MESLTIGFSLEVLLWWRKGRGGARWSGEERRALEVRIRQGFIGGARGFHMPVAGGAGWWKGEVGMMEED